MRRSLGSARFLDPWLELSLSRLLDLLPSGLFVTRAPMVECPRVTVGASGEALIDALISVRLFIAAP
jgi:hypothetical protein